MKKAISVVGIIVLLTLNTIPAGAGLIALMRGEPESSTPKQRVAFVGSATVKSVDGNAERLCGIDCWTPITVGTHLKVGDIIRTGQGAVVLKMDESLSFVKVTPNTVLRLIPVES